MKRLTDRLIFHRCEWCKTVVSASFDAEVETPQICAACVSLLVHLEDAIQGPFSYEEQSTLHNMMEGEMTQFMRDKYADKYLFLQGLDHRTKDWKD